MTLFEYLELDKKELEQIKLDINNFYFSFPIKKTSGKLRWIDAPQNKLKDIQYKLLYKLLYTQKPHSIAVAYIKRLGIPEGAKRHLGAKVLLTLDLEQFFPSIRAFPDIVNIVTKSVGTINNHRQDKLLFTAYDIQLITYILSYKGSLPQGAPSSPAIANCVCYNMDKSLNELMISLTGKHNCKFTCTRYCDDIAISCDNINIPMLEVKKEVAEIIEKNKFTINEKKTKIRRPNSRMSVTGITINYKLGVPRWKWRNLRAKIHQLIQNKIIITKKEYISLLGQIEWIRQLNPVRGNILLRALGKIKPQN